MPSLYRLGKLPARHDPRTLRLADYTAQLSHRHSPFLPWLDYGERVRAWPSYDNEVLSDCTCAAVGHLIEAWTTNLCRPRTPSLSEILRLYEAVSGYRRGDAAGDRGAQKLDVLNFWRKHAVADCRITAYVSLEPGNRDLTKDAIHIFGGAYVGLRLPASAAQQLRAALNETVWSVPACRQDAEGAPGSWGGHSVALVGYDDRTVTAISWGSPVRMTWQFFEAYCDEAYAVWWEPWIDARPFPAGFAEARLRKDLAAVTYPDVPAGALRAGGGVSV